MKKSTLQKLRLLILPLILAITLLFCLPPTYASKDEPYPLPPVTVSISKTNIFPGDYFVVYVNNLRSSDQVTLATSLAANNPPLMSYGSGQIAVFAVNYRTKPGQYPLTIGITRNGNVLFEQEEEIVVTKKDFPIQYLRVTASQQSVRTEEKQKADSILVNQAKADSFDAPLWTGPFILPVEGRISTEYGLIRYINNVESGRHAGIDIATPRGTPIKAANNGIIKLSLPLHVSGNTVIIDHGLNFFSAYSHLDTLLVQVGDTVAKGDIIGEVGSTGFSTGPHLHWTVSSGLHFLNPWLFLNEDPLGWLND